jgi:hypothetical protein
MNSANSHRIPTVFDQLKIRTILLVCGISLVLQGVSLCGAQKTPPPKFKLPPPKQQQGKPPKRPGPPEPPPKPGPHPPKTPSSVPPNQPTRPEVKTMSDGSTRTTHNVPGQRPVIVTEKTVPGVGKVTTTSLGPGHVAVERPVFGHPNMIRISRRVGGRSTAVVYRKFSYGGREFSRPIPQYVYSPGFYSWGLQPWPGTVVYGWGWQAQAWYSVYGGVFTPYPTYAGLNFWLTDYILSNNLQQDYDAAQPAPSDPAPVDIQPTAVNAAEAAPPAITAEMKAEIAAQVQVEIQEQQRAAAAGTGALAAPANGAVTEDTPDALRPGHTIFRVVVPLSVRVAGQECKLTPDDFITRIGTLNDDATVTVKVRASRSVDCAQGATTNVSLNDLMAMDGEEQERVNEGLTLASRNVGANGLPPGPAASPKPVPGAQAVPDPQLADALKDSRS